MTFHSIESKTYSSGGAQMPTSALTPVSASPFAAAESAGARTAVRSPGPHTYGHAALVLSTIGNRTDFDWCGSFAQAIRMRSARIDSGEYDRVCLRRVRRVGSRRGGTKRWLYVSRPVMEWKRTLKAV
jgi:hypothetical protein